MKSIYEAPLIKYILFSDEDVISTSYAIDLPFYPSMDEDEL